MIDKRTAAAYAFVYIIAGVLTSVVIHTGVFWRGKSILGPCGCCRSSDAKIRYDPVVAAAKENVVPIVVIGSGPGGLGAGLYGAGQYDTVVVAGHEPSLLSETAYVENWLGAPHTLGMELIERSRVQAQSAGARFVDDAVVSIDCTSWPYKLELAGGSVVHALAVIAATGARPRMLGIPGEKEYWAKGVSACARCDAAFYKGKDVIVVGGGDSAITEAVELARYARTVTIIHRKSQLRAGGRTQKILKEYPQIKVMFNVEAKEIVGDSTRVTGLKILHNDTNTPETMEIGGLFLAIGHTPNSELLKGVVALDGDGYVELEGRTQKTSKPGVFAVGDVADRHYRQAIVAAGEGAKAGIEAIEFLESSGFTLAQAKSLRRYMPQAQEG